MNSNPYALPAFIFLAAVLFGCGAWAFLVITRQPPAGRHARIPGPSAEGARFAADLQGLPQPPEEQPASREPEEPEYDTSYDHPGWWDDDPPQSAAVEILTGPAAPIRQTSEVTIGTLARLRDALLPEAWRPDEPGDVTFTPADPDATRTDLKAVPFDGQLPGGTYKPSVFNSTAAATAGDAPQYLAAPQ